MTGPRTSGYKTLKKVPAAGGDQLTVDINQQRNMLSAIRRRDWRRRRRRRRQRQMRADKLAAITRAGSSAASVARWPSERRTDRRTDGRRQLHWTDGWPLASQPASQPARRISIITPPHYIKNSSTEGDRLRTASERPTRSSLYCSRVSRSHRNTRTIFYCWTIYVLLAKKK